MLIYLKFNFLAFTEEYFFKKRNMNKGCTDQRCPVGLCGSRGHSLCWVGWGFMGFVLMVLAHSIQIFGATSK